MSDLARGQELASLGNKVTESWQAVLVGQIRLLKGEHEDLKQFFGVTDVKLHTLLA